MTLSRRNFLQAAAGTCALPWLETFGGFAHAADSGAKVGPQRLLMVCLPLGIFRKGLVPEEAGRDFAAPAYLKAIDEFRNHYTVISGLEHPGVNGGHSSQPRIFTGIPSHQQNVRSLDQYVASIVGRETRFDSLVLASGRNDFSWTDSGSNVPAETKMATVYAKLFGQEDKASTDKVLREIGQGKSILDLVQRQAGALRPQLTQADQDKLEEYFESVRATERRLVKSESWVHTPKPHVDADMPQDPTSRAEIITQLRNVCDMTFLAFQTDSSRVITFGYFEQNNVNIPGVQNAYHALSHHGQDPNNIAQLMRIEQVFFDELKTLLTNLKNTREGDTNLLERTTIVVTSNLGNGSNHSTRDLPMLLLGGRYGHGQHLAFEPSSVPLSNLYVSILNQFGLGDKTFATATGPLPGLEIA